MSDVTRVIGIDFGTSTSVVCVKRYQDGKPVGDAFSSSSVTFGNGQGDTRAYTVVRRNGDGTCTCGREAGDPAPGAEIFREFKMDLENPDDAKRAQARALTEEFFKYLYRWYDHQRSDMGGAGDKEKTLVSYPAKWSEDTRQFMAEAAVKAGFPDVSVMDEPSAALYATLTRRMNDVSAKGLLHAGEPGYMLLIDMGAGTTDLAVCRYSVEAGTDGIIRAEQIRNEIVSTWPESANAPTFGGREVDRLLEDYLTDYMISCGLSADMARQLVCGAAAVKPWKESVVSARLNEGAPVDSCGFLSGYMMLLPQKQPFPAIDREKFEGLLAEKLEDFKALVTGCLDKASEAEPAIAQNGIDLVVLTGGHSAWYFTEALLNGTMSGLTHPALKRVQTEKSRVLRLSNPQETVALGLVYSMLPLDTKKAEEPRPQPPVEEMTRTTDTADADTHRQRAVIGPSDAEKNGDAYYNTALRFIKDWIEVFSTNSAPYLDNSVQNEIDWRGENTCSYTVAMRPDGLSASSYEDIVSVSWYEFITGDLTGGQKRSISLNTKILPVNTSCWLEVFGFLAMLQRVLRGKSIWEAELCAANTAAYPNAEVTANIDHFIQRNQNLLHDDSFDPSKESLFRTSLRIPASDKILLANMSATIFKSNFGKDGWAITPKGIYAHNLTAHFMNWSEFAKTKFFFNETGPSLSVPNGIWLRSHKISFPVTGKRYAQYLDFFLALRAHAKRITYAG